MSSKAKLNFNTNKMKKNICLYSLFIFMLIFSSCDDDETTYVEEPKQQENLFVKDTIPMILDKVDKLHRLTEITNFFPMPKNYDEAISKSYDIDNLNNGNIRVWMSSDTLKETFGDFTIKAYKKGEIVYNSYKEHTSNLSCDIPTYNVNYDFIFLNTSRREFKDYAELMEKLKIYVNDYVHSSFLYDKTLQQKYKLGTILWSMSGDCNFLYLDGTPVKD